MIFCQIFVDAAIKVLSGQLPYHGYIDYAISALAHVDTPADRSKIEVEELLALVDSALQASDVTVEAKTLANTLKAKEQQIKDNWAVHADKYTE